MSVVFRAWGTLVKTDEDLVLFVSFMGMRYNDSPKAIYEYMKAHPQYDRYHCVWAFEHPEEYPQLSTVKIDTLNYFHMALKAKYWITNTNIERGLHFKKKCTIYLNTWHGMASKKIGNDCLGRKDYNFGAIDYLVVSGALDETAFESAFNAKEKSFLRCGMPRNDVLWEANEDSKNALRIKLGIPKDKKAIFYAPTWRDSVDGGKTYDIKIPVNFEKWHTILGDEYIVFFRAHHLTTKIMGIHFDDFIRDASGYPDVNDLMIASDLLVTDYSSIAFDYAILGKPIFCFAYDYDTYLAERGVYLPIDENYPSPSCRTEDELLNKIRQMDYKEECKHTIRFRNEFVQYGGNATETCAKKIFKQ